MQPLLTPTDPDSLAVTAFEPCADAFAPLPDGPCDTCGWLRTEHRPLAGSSPVLVLTPIVAARGAGTPLRRAS